MLLPAFASTLAAFSALASLSAASPLAARNNDNATAVEPSANANVTAPPLPQLKWLYTAMVDCPADLLPNVTSPAGRRKGIPIVGGNVTMADGSFWTIRDLGADWGTVDPRTGIFTADTRYNAYNDEGDDLYMQTMGPGQAGGGLHLRATLETGSEKYYWLNHVIAFGTLQSLPFDERNLSTKVIHMYNFVDDRNASTIHLLD
ncbi:uncharacterized protein JCM10292_007728 [Rhodotorula paludigena]|uniref:uncharacterized protein n=1 Tax=Rhodotorula paludigena TaxID=86838 RepID=UPI00318276CD